MKSVKADFLKFILVLLVAVSGELFARDNPFKPVISSTTLGKATNIKDNIKPLSLQKLTIPSASRILKAVKLEIVNVDGSESEIKFDINKKIDWHKGIYISNSKIKIDTRQKKPEPKLLTPFGFLSIMIDDKKLFLKTNDRMLRELFFSKPYKIAMDFSRKVSFYTKKILLKKLPFVKIVIGNHGKFYRVVLELDGKYEYKITKKSNGYLVELY